MTVELQLRDRNVQLHENTCVSSTYILQQERSGSREGKERKEMKRLN